MTVATRAQKKLLHIVLMLKTLLISCGEGLAFFRGEDGKDTNFYGKQHTSDGGTECNSYTRGTRGSENFAHFDWVKGS